jgi:tyrosyl-tRNA synthetase
MKRETHPMQAKKDLARRIVADFHSAEAAAKAEEDWGKQFQKSEVPEDVEEVTIDIAQVESSPEGTTPMEVAGEILGASERRIKLDRLLYIAKLADSISDAVRKLKQRSVKVDDELKTDPVIFLDPSKKINIRVGRKIKRVAFTQKPLPS